MTVAAVNRAIRAVEDGLPPLARQLLDMPPDKLADWIAWREQSAAWHRDNPNAYARWLADEIEPPQPPAGLFPPLPVLVETDDPADIYGRIVG
jgi:hypothetical protein